MMENQITQEYKQSRTIMVHSLISNQNLIEPTANQSPIIKMEYQYDSPTKNSENLRDRIKCKSFYEDQKRLMQHKNKISKNRTYIKFMQKQGQSLSQPKIIDLEFSTFSKAKPKKQSAKPSMSSQDYYSIMVDSMQSYIKKVENGKKKKLEKCQKIRNFGVNIQAIRARPEEQRIQKMLQKPLKGFGGSIMVHREPNATISQINRKSSQNKIAQLSDCSNYIKTISTHNSTKKAKTITKRLSIKLETKDNYKKIHFKLQRMFHHFSIILSSFGVVLSRAEQKSSGDGELKLKKNDRKYTYYIGKGNNKFLIVSILKKRWWWLESEDLNSANFVWTQTKVNSVLQKQASMAYSELAEADPALYVKDKYESHQSQGIRKMGNIFHKKHSTKFYEKLSLREQKKYLRNMRTPQIVHNHYEANYMLGNKKALYYNMSQYKQFRKQNLFEYLPYTFHVEKTSSKSFKLFEKKAREEKKSLWIVKPGENSNRGQGIFVSDNIQTIKAKIEKNKRHTYIIQKYIKNNLTFQRRKFDIRTYLLMVSIGGVQKFYWYSEGYLRTASEIYDLSDLQDPFIHLTNDAIQITGENYGKFQKGNKITYSEFQRYLDINYPNDKFQVSALVEKMKIIAKQVVQATYFKIDPCRKQYSFELFGLDFLIDSNFKPWLLEVNTNPCLQLSSPVLERLIPRMIENLFRIAVDPVFQPQQNDLPRNLVYYVPDNIIESNRFELIFDSLHDRNLEWQKFSSEQNSAKVYQDENQQFENDGELIKIED